MRPFWIWRSHADTTYQLNSQSITPIVQLIGLRWPGGGWLWQYPLAIDVEEHADGTQQRLPIPDPTRTVVWFLGTLALLVILLAGLTLWRRGSARGKRKLSATMQQVSKKG